MYLSVLQNMKREIKKKWIAKKDDKVARACKQMWKLQLGKMRKVHGGSN